MKSYFDKVRVYVAAKMKQPGMSAWLAMVACILGLVFCLYLIYPDNPKGGMLGIALFGLLTGVYMNEFQKEKKAAKMQAREAKKVSVKRSHRMHKK